MSDIVDELQNYIPGMPVGWLLDEAKGEIEALRAEVETWKESHAAAIDLIRAEILEEAAQVADVYGPLSAAAIRALKGTT
jgi:hypothetical protein